jgi:hypothetical protein
MLSNLEAFIYFDSKTLIPIKCYKCENTYFELNEQSHYWCGNCNAFLGYSINSEFQKANINSIKRTFYRKLEYSEIEEIEK